MGDNPIRVSVIMPAYNAETTLFQAVESALRQTESRLEVLIIDDASTDGTVAIAEALATRDTRVRILRQRSNRGPAAARNRGLAEAAGTWIALLDADDEFSPERLETLLAMGESHAADTVADNLLLCPAGDATHATPMISVKALPAAKWMSAAEFVTGNIGSRFTPRISYGFMQPMIRQDFLKRHGLLYNERNRFGEDYLFALNLLLCGARWWITPAAMYRYRVQSGTLTEVQSAADLMRIRQFEDRLLRTHPMVASNPALASALHRHKRVIEHFYHYRAFTDALKASQFKPAARLLLQSLSGFRHIMTESMLQAPRVMLKALRGGFRHPPGQVALSAALGLPPNTGTSSAIARK
ncbi:MAG TPA: glycosyltransferase family 2 protein [Acetobacteraceae bacterium]|jgi:succinoglycan biosynthesis protein ExoO|nr:glycosyltransferase family 2 protein [Acetobacteraceae bacterium]